MDCFFHGSRSDYFCIYQFFSAAGVRGCLFPGVSVVLDHFQRSVFRMGSLASAQTDELISACAVFHDPQRAAAVQGGLQEIRRAQQLRAGERAGHARGQELRARGL